MRSRAITSLVLAGLASTLLAATPSQAAPDRPRLSIVGATTSSIVLDWPDVGAHHYEIRWADNLSMNRERFYPQDRDSVALTGSQATIGGLPRGKVHCFQVRAVDRNGKGSGWSPRTCKPTIVSQAPNNGNPYDVMTYNVCSDPCGRWRKRDGHVLRVIRKESADVVALQENGDRSRLVKQLADQYIHVHSQGKRTLLVKRDTFELVSRKRTGAIVLGRERIRGRGLVKRWAVWGEVRDIADGDRMIFTSVHASSGNNTTRAKHDLLRKTNIQNLVRKMNRINHKRWPVVHAGDFNSHRGHAYDAPRVIFGRNGYRDAYDLAMRLDNPLRNSVNSMEAVPRVSSLWGSHVDKVFAKPGQVRVEYWRSAAPMDGNRYATPIPSDHNPIVVTIQVN